MYPNMATILSPVDSSSTLIQAPIPSTFGAILNHSFIQTSALEGIETLRLNLFKPLSTEFQPNLTEVFLHEPRVVSDVPEKVYYGRIRTMSNISERQDDDKSASEIGNIEGSSGSFFLYEFLKKLQPRPAETIDADGNIEEKQKKQMSSRLTKIKGNKSSMSNTSMSRYSTIFTDLNAHVFPLTSIPMNAFRSGMVSGSGNNNSNNETNDMKNGRKISDVISDEDTRSTGFKDHFAKRLGNNKTLKFMETLNDQGTDTRWRRITNLLMDIVQNPKKDGPEKSNPGADLFNQSNFGIGAGEEKFNLFNSILANWTSDLGSAMQRRRGAASHTILLLTSYSLLLLVSLFANLLVCHVVLRTRRLHTVTNTFLANLAVSDLVMTTMNIPFSVARVLLDDWPFGAVMCGLVPFVQVVSVYVSSFTMAAIALDRYQVIIRPLRPRMGATHGALIIAIIWVMAALFALPYAIYNQVVEVFTYRRLVRCQPRYPPPALVFRRWLTLATFLTQYALPLSLTLLAYAAVVRRVWWGATVGVSTRQQATLRIRAKKTTVKMLMVVVIVFAFCWLPLNTYHLVVDFSSPVGSSRHSSSVFFSCHWLAMSSVCYNPFIYCWLNDHFRAGARSLFTCAGRRIARILGCASRRRSCQDGIDDCTEADLQHLGGYIIRNTSRDDLAAVVPETTHQSTTSGETATSSSSSSSAITCVPLSTGWKGGGRSSILKNNNNRDPTIGRERKLRKQVNFGSHQKIDHFKSARTDEVNIPMHKLFMGKGKSARNADASSKSVSMFEQRASRMKTNPTATFSNISPCSSLLNNQNVLLPSGSRGSERRFSQKREDFCSSGCSNQHLSEFSNPPREGNSSHFDEYSAYLSQSRQEAENRQVHFRYSFVPENRHSSGTIDDNLCAGKYRDRNKLYSFDNLHWSLRGDSSVEMSGANPKVVCCDFAGFQRNNQPRNRPRPNSMDDMRRYSYDPPIPEGIKSQIIGDRLFMNGPQTKEKSPQCTREAELFQAGHERTEQGSKFAQGTLGCNNVVLTENSDRNVRTTNHSTSTWDDHCVGNCGSTCICNKVGDDRNMYCFHHLYNKENRRRYTIPSESTKTAKNIEHRNWYATVGSNAFLPCMAPKIGLPSTTTRRYSVDYLNDV